MKINNYRIFVTFIVLFIFVSLITFEVSSTANYIHNTLQTNYSALEQIRGNVYLRLANHPGNELITSNFNGSITLRDLLKNQSNIFDGIDYNCTTNGCVNSYTSSNSIEQLTLSSTEPKFVGFRIGSSGTEVTEANLEVNTNSLASCTPNLYVDLFADGQDLLTSSKASTESCGIKHTGCYDLSNNALATITIGKKYCEKISIPATPAFILGGTITRGSGESNLSMQLYDMDEISLGSCRLPQNIQNSEELKCTVNYSSFESNEYYVCLSTKVNNDYKIGWETTTPNCGTALDFNSLNSDFDLFAETMKYDSSVSITINESNYDQHFRINLVDKINDYIQETYNGECQQNTCFIPIKIFGGNQVIALNGAKIDYESFGVPTQNEEVYLLNYEYPKITANNLSIDISKANFIIPYGSTENKFKLYIQDRKLFEKDIFIKKSFVFDIYPKFIAFGQGTLFTAFSNVANITSTTWDFGNGVRPKTVNGTSIGYTHLTNSSFFDINVSAISNKTIATRQFRIFVGSPKDIINQTILGYRKRSVNITAQINSYPVWVGQKINAILNIENLTSELNSIESRYKNATREEDYQNIMIDLVELNVPLNIFQISSGSNIPLSAGWQNFNMDYLEQIENKDVVDNDALKDKVVTWMNDNFNPLISFKKIKVFGTFEDIDIGTTFTIITNPIKDVSKSYLIFGQDIKTLGSYKENYSILSTSSGIDYIILEGGKSQTFEFIINGDNSYDDLGAYIAPSIELLGNIDAPQGECTLNNICEDNENANSCPEDCSNKWFKFTLIGWIILFIMGFILYIILQEWYKKNYQKSLFPDENDLYNLVAFIYNARKNSLSDYEIKSKLRMQKWPNEKINFAFNKVDGKRIWMFEIPLFTRKEHKETVRQISSRTEGVDARFIKRPFLN